MIDISIALPGLPGMKCGHCEETALEFLLTEIFYFNRVRVSLLLLFHIPETLQAGSNCHLNPLLNKSSSMPERV